MQWKNCFFHFTFSHAKFFMVDPLLYNIGSLLLFGIWCRNCCSRIQPHLYIWVWILFSFVTALEKGSSGRKLKHDVIEAVNELIQDITSCHEQIAEQAVEHIHQKFVSPELLEIYCLSLATLKILKTCHTRSQKPDWPVIKKTCEEKHIYMSRIGIGNITL